MEKTFTHTNQQGKAHMVDVGDKPNQERLARASGHINLQPGTLQLIEEDTMKKGDVLTVAEIAGVMAAKKTNTLIPLCHPLLLNKIDVYCTPDETGITATAEVRCTGKTGVEMEALTAVSIALLTIYDMCKAVDKSMVIHDITLIEKIKR
ncbi:MAG: cyclic pyranopterin monophosphate synthase MoaC [Bacteroidales bacterium]|nr:cyclic pyranopterin monophosphate synthase MoaC [Bacteroidales bacterium]